MQFVFLLLKIVFLPLFFVYNAVILVRNWLFDKQIIKSFLPEIPVISIGNLSLGGTGKTPHVEYLIRLLNQKYKLSTLSRGYGRKTKGFLWADESANASTIGDEPMQYYLKFKNKINVIVCENRVFAVHKIQTLFKDNDVVILDDAFQHRRITPHLNLLLSTYDKPFYEDSLLPFGRLRDIKSSAKRADAIVITKCPSIITETEKKQIRSSISACMKTEIPIFFSKIYYQTITAYADECLFDVQKKSHVVSAIAKPEFFIQYLNEQSLLLGKIFNFPDHHAFSRRDINKFLKDGGEETQIITTEKDMVKLKPQLTKSELKCFFYVPIEVVFDEKVVFETFVFEGIRNFILKRHKDTK